MANVQHRPRFLHSSGIYAKGRQRKRYRYEDFMPPADKLGFLHNAAGLLKRGPNWQPLDASARELDASAAVVRMSAASEALFHVLNPQSGAA